MKKKLCSKSMNKLNSNSVNTNTVFFYGILKYNLNCNLRDSTLSWVPFPNIILALLFTQPLALLQKPWIYHVQHCSFFANQLQMPSALRYHCFMILISQCLWICFNILWDISELQTFGKWFKMSYVIKLWCNCVPHRTKYYVM